MAFIPFPELTCLACVAVLCSVLCLILSAVLGCGILGAAVSAVLHGIVHLIRSVVFVLAVGFIAVVLRHLSFLL